MAKQANRMMIGGFVVLALILLAVSLAIFGSGKFFKKTQKFVLYFEEPVKGLDIGAPVLFDGVAVGSVTSIIIVAEPVKKEIYIPVIIEIELERFQLQEAGETINPQKNMPKLIKTGLRAQLGMQSLITGKLLIELGFYPDTQVNLKNINKDFTEIPTLPSTTFKLAKALDKLNLEEIQNKVESALEAIANLFDNPELTASIKALKDTLQNARKFIARVDRQVDPLANDAKKTVKDIGKLANNVNGRVQGLATNLNKTLSSARGVISEDAPVMVELENSLKEISAMGRSLRLLADYLEQHPETLIRGKKKSGGKNP